MDLFNNQTQAFFVGQKIPKVSGFNAVDKFSLPRDCEAFFLDEENDIGYIKKTDVNGNGYKIWMFDMKEKPIPVFDPDKYVTKDEMNQLKEDITRGFDDLKQALSARSGAKRTRSDGTEE